VAQAGVGKKHHPIAKITVGKMAGNVAQVVQCLPSKPKARSSNLSTTEKRKKIKQKLQ
jgi:hypothetical protein